eukprot:m.202995 g.202995  ORF g.202995 m.202995 type:complete len:135 (+) comp53846_c0_seq11:324-728(+)
MRACCAWLVPVLAPKDTTDRGSMLMSKHPLLLSLAVACLSLVRGGPVQYLGWWQNNSTATAPFTTFAFLQLFPADLVSDKQLGLTGLWNLDGRDSRPKPDCLAFLWCDGRFFRGGPACTLTWQGNDIDLGSNVR